MGGTKMIRMLGYVAIISLLLTQSFGKKLNVYREPEETNLFTVIKNLVKLESDSHTRDSVAEDATIKVELTNNGGTSYTGNLLFGDNKQSMELLFDTGSPWLWVPLAECATCQPKNGKYTPASTYKESNSNAKATYVDGKFVEGNVATDEIRITDGDDHISMKIIGVKNEEGMESLTTVADGILGLAPSAHSRTDLFFSQLKKQGLISKGIFGLELKPEGEVSSIIFGGYDETVVPDEDKIAWIDLYNTDSWWTEFKHVNYEDKHVSSKGGLVVFDSGTSFTTMSENILLSFITNFYKDGETCSMRPFEGETLWHCPCNSPADFGNIGISMNGWEVFLDAETIIKDGGNNQCAIQIVPGQFEGNKDIILLGANFLVNYYAIHDIDNKRIGLSGVTKENDDSAFSTGISSTLFCFLLSFLFLNY